jgi:hypothetical protein
MFPEEVEFVRVPQSKSGRVFMLHFKTSGEKKFFWAQDAKDDKDEENVTKVNRLINDPQAALAESRRQPGISSTLRNLDDLSGFGMGMDQDQLLQLLQQPGNAFGGLTIPSTTPANEPQQSSTSTTAPSAARTDAAATSQQTDQTGPIGVTPEHLGTLRNILSEIQVPGS